ncbi:MAG: hypothetical protein IAE78_15480 [Myxococcus sp.]|nr:hypothetical protein [Myxococcus sp.]
MTRPCAIALLLTASGCAYSVQGAVFRTREAETAFARAVKAVEAHCNGVRFTNPDAQVVTSHWRVFHSRDGAFLGRCQVAVIKAADELGADVRVAVTLKQCPLIDLADVDAVGDSAACEITFSMPGEVATGQQDAVRKVEYDVRR